MTPARKPDAGAAGAGAAAEVVAGAMEVDAGLVVETAGLVVVTAAFVEVAGTAGLAVEEVVTFDGVEAAPWRH